jgi:alanyl-tRNA synthetase
VATKRLYYADSYLRDFQANAVGDVADSNRIYLDQTAFYPTSGGQPHDLGTLNGIPIEDVVDEGDQIAHVLRSPLKGSTVSGAIDWERRYDHMQQHTGQHLLSAVCDQMLNAATLSFHMGSEVSTIDLQLKELSEAQLSALEEQVNEAARGSSCVTVSFEEAESAAGLRKQSDRSGTLRIVNIDHYDRSACGGTHVRNLSEVLPMQLRRTEKMRGNIRLEFACGQRAIRLARKDLRTLSQLARLAGTPFDQTLDHFTTLRQRLTDAEKERQRLEKHLAEREGRDLYNASSPSADGLRRLCQRVARIDEAQRSKAQAYLSQSKAGILLLSPDSVLIGFSPDSGLNAGAVLKQTIAGCGGSGGGSPTLAQGKLTGGMGEQTLAEAGGFRLPCDNLQE